ncbi:hypothetical protein LTS18_006733, partial [Coniosporium uncinatum]
MEHRPSLASRPSQYLEPNISTLDPNSYTAQKLTHATPEHLYLTTRRCFVGPIPEGWLKSHRKEWYQRHLNVSDNYRSQAATFFASENTTRDRRVTGLSDTDRKKARQSFPQPEDIQEEEGEALTEEPPALSVPRSSNPNQDVGQARSRSARRGSGKDDHQSGGVEDEAAGKSEHPGEANEHPSPLAQGRSTKARTNRKFERSESKQSNSSFVTARSVQTSAQAPGISIDQGDTSSASMRNAGHERPRQTSLGESLDDPASSGVGEPAGEMTSTTSLIGRNKSQHDADGGVAAQRGEAIRKNIMCKTQRTGTKQPVDLGPPAAREEGVEDVGGRVQQNRSGLVQFAVPEQSTRGDLLRRARLTQMQLRRSAAGIGTFRRQTANNGQIIKMEKMLVRVDATRDSKLPDYYDENASQSVIAKTLDKWREYMVVCRQSADGDAEFLLQMYKTRVIPAIEGGDAKKKKIQHEVALGRKYANANLFSALDKTLVVWKPTRYGTSIFLLRPRTGSNGAEWYTFLRNILGGARASELQVNIPDLGVGLRLADPFAQLEATSAAAEDDEGVVKTIQEEQAIAKNI